jgi:hypothetical protein
MLIIRWLIPLNPQATYAYANYMWLEVYVMQLLVVDLMGKIGLTSQQNSRT